MDSDLGWVNGKSGRQSWRYADAFQRSIISEAIYHFYGETVSVFQFQGCADVWNNTAVKQCCRWSALFHASTHPWNWNKTKLSTVGWNEAPTVGSFVLLQFLADRTNGRAIGTVLRPSVCRLSSSSYVTLCIVAERCVLEQKLLLRAYRKSYMRNRLVPKWMTLTFV